LGRGIGLGKLPEKGTVGKGSWDKAKTNQGNEAWKRTKSRIRSWGVYPSIPGELPLCPPKKKTVKRYGSIRIRKNF